MVGWTSIWCAEDHRAYNHRLSHTHTHSIPFIPSVANKEVCKQVNSNNINIHEKTWACVHKVSQSRNTDLGSGSPSYSLWFKGQIGSEISTPTLRRFLNTLPEGTDCWGTLLYCTRSRSVFNQSCVSSALDILKGISNWVKSAAFSVNAISANAGTLALKAVLSTAPQRASWIESRPKTFLLFVTLCKTALICMSVFFYHSRLLPSERRCAVLYCTYWRRGWGKGLV